MKSDERKFQIPYKWRCDVSITVNIYYTGENGSARKFAEEMIACNREEKHKKQF